MIDTITKVTKGSKVTKSAKAAQSAKATQSANTMQIATVMLAGVLGLLTLDRPSAAAQTWSVRGALDAGGQWFTAADSFNAVLGTDRSPLIGISGEVVLPQRVFGSVRWSRFEEDGRRVFVFEGEPLDLGIDTTVRLTPVEITGGYRFANLIRRVIPYVGAGLGWHRYEETSEFAEGNDNVDETHRGYHLLGGAEFRLSRWFGVAGEVQWTTVPDALGQDPNSASAEFGEDDLGGAAVRVKFVVGR